MDGLPLDNAGVTAAKSIFFARFFTRPNRAIPIRKWTTENHVFVGIYEGIFVLRMLLMFGNNEFIDKLESQSWLHISALCFPLGDRGFFVFLTAAKRANARLPAA